MAAMASTCTKVQENENEVNQTEESGRENRFIDEWKLEWSEEELFEEPGELPMDLMSLDFEFALLDAGEKQEQETQPYSTSENPDIEAGTKGKSLALEDILDQLLDSSWVDSSMVSSETEETSSNNEATEPSLEFWSILHSIFDDNGQILPSEEPLPASTSKYYDVTNQSLSDGSLLEVDFMSNLDHFSLLTPDPSLNSELSEDSFDSTSVHSSRDVLQEGSTSLSHLDGTESSQLPEGFPSEDPLFLKPSFHSSDAQSSGNPWTVADEDPEQGSEAGSFTVSPFKLSGPPNLSVLAWKALQIPSVQMKEAVEQCIPKTINANASCLADCPVPEQANSSGHTDSTGEAFGTQVDANLSDTKEMEKLPPKINEALRRRSKRGRPLKQRDLGDSEEKSKATQVSKTKKQLKEIEEKAQQHRSGDILKPEVEEAGLCKSKYPEVSTEIGSEKPLSTNMTQDDKDCTERARGESIPESVRTTSPVREEQLHPSPLPEGAERRLRRSQIKSSTKRIVQNDCKLEVPEPRIQTNLNPTKKKKRFNR